MWQTNRSQSCVSCLISSFGQVLYHLLVKHVPPTYLLFCFFRLIFLVDFFVEGENTFLCCLFSDNFLYKKLSFDNKNTSIFPEEASPRKKVSILVAQLFNDLHKTLLVMAKDVEGIVQAPLTSKRDKSSIWQLIATWRRSKRWDLNLPGAEGPCIHGEGEEEEEEGVGLLGESLVPVGCLPPGALPTLLRPGITIFLTRVWSHQWHWPSVMPCSETSWFMQHQWKKEQEKMERRGRQILRSKLIRAPRHWRSATGHLLLILTILPLSMVGRS